jgi:hypothetical protein
VSEPREAQGSGQCGVWVLDLRSAEVVAFLRFTGSIREVQAVNVLPMRYPELLNEEHDLVANSFYLPENAG